MVKSFIIDIEWTDKSKGKSSSYVQVVGSKKKALPRLHYLYSLIQRIIGYKWGKWQKHHSRQAIFDEE